MFTKINIDRKKRISRVNEASQMNVPWEQKYTRNIVTMLEVINDVAIHKFDADLFARFKRGEFSSAVPLWQELNVISKEFNLLNMLQEGSGHCICGHHIEQIWNIQHQSGVVLTMGRDCINRIFPTLMVVNYRKLVKEITETINAGDIPVVYGDEKVYMELYFNVNPKAIMPYAYSAYRNSENLLTRGYGEIKQTYTIYFEKLLRFLGLKEYEVKFKTLVHQHNAGNR